MSESLHIARKNTAEDASAFSSLRSEGLSLLQDLAGKRWTDYNLHDPGVTILEQVCYALSELAYRADFDVADFLTSPDGQIDYKHQALYRPAEIFPCQPTTADDYRKIIYDAVPEVDNVWVLTAEPTDHTETGAATDNPWRYEPGPYRGLYRICADLGQSDVDPRAIEEKIKNLYAANRNLCEDLADVRIVKRRPYALFGSIEVAGNRPPELTLAELYFKYARRFVPGVSLHSFEEMQNDDNSLEDIFSGPPTQHGYIVEDKTKRPRGYISIPDLIQIVDEIDDVRYIINLWFEDHSGGKKTGQQLSVTATASELGVPCLQLPTQEREIYIKLCKDGRYYQPNWSGVKAELDRLYAAHQADRQTPRHHKDVHSLPQGHYRDFGDYYSLQHHFPDIYGINSFGVPPSATPKRKAQAKQLKAYLLLFEQITANYLANLRGCLRLFSLEENLDRTYFSTALDDKVPGASDLFDRGGSDLEAAVAAALRKRDPFGDRRKRVLDYLLGLYGETLSHDALRHFNFYYLAEELDQQLICNKIAYLQHLIAVGRKRAGAFDYRRLSWNTDNTSGLKKKVSLLLGLTFFHDRSLGDVFTENGLKLIGDDDSDQALRESTDLEFVDQGDIDERVDQYFSSVAPLEAQEADRSLFEEIIYLKRNDLPGPILRGGVDIGKYKVGSVGNSDVFQLILKPDATRPWHYLAAYPTEAEAHRAANDFRRLMIKLNVESEGLHVVEHLLLRPTTPADTVAAESTLAKKVPDAFYSFRISVLMPGWTARFNDREFRKLAAETVQGACPAHIYPQLFWLDFGQMHEFENRYRTWLDLQCTSDADPSRVEEAATKLTAFLLAAEETAGITEERLADTASKGTGSPDDGLSPGSLDSAIMEETLQRVTDDLRPPRPTTEPDNR